MIRAEPSVRRQTARRGPLIGLSEATGLSGVLAALGDTTIGHSPASFLPPLNSTCLAHEISSRGHDSRPPPAAYIGFHFARHPTARVFCRPNSCAATDSSVEYETMPVPLPSF